MTPCKKTILLVSVFGLVLGGALFLHPRGEGGLSSASDVQSTVREPVMGTIAQLTVRGRAGVPPELWETVRTTYARLEGLLSAWNPQSELSRLAAADGTNWVASVSPEVKPCYAAALKLARESGGAFNPFLGRTLRALGVGHGTYANFDLGAIAKGFAVDRAADELLKGTDPSTSKGTDLQTSLLLDLGGNLRVVGPGIWRTGIRNPFAVRDPQQPPHVAILALTNGESVATSGTYERFIEKDGKRLSHILDGRTGQPTHGLAGVTVVTPPEYGAMLADGLSTTLFVLGPDAGQEFLQAHYPKACALWIPDTPEKPHLIATAAMAARLLQPALPVNP